MQNYIFAIQHHFFRWIPGKILLQALLLHEILEYAEDFSFKNSKTQTQIPNKYTRKNTPRVDVRGDVKESRNLGRTGLTSQMNKVLSFGPDA